MSHFTKSILVKNMIPESDEGIKISDLIVLINDNEIAKHLKTLLNIDSTQNEFISIKGSKTLVDIQHKINRKFHKEDLASELKNITLYKGGDFSINFDNINNEYFNNLQTNYIETTPIYSAAKDFFSELFQMDKYASSLINKGYRKIIDSNLQMLKEVLGTEKKYRILHDKDDNQFYLRAIISLNNYHNYDNNVALVVALITLHNEMKNSDVIYNLKSCEYNESFIKIIFESSEIKALEKIGKVKNFIEVSNDEIKREALKFSGICSIVFGSEADLNKELFIQPNHIKSRILSVKHNQIPKTAIQELANINKTQKVHQELFDDILSITKIKDAEQIKFLVKDKVEKSTTQEIKKLKPEILKELNKKAVDIVQLLTMFKKVELLAGEDIEAVDFLRYTISEALINPKRK